MKKEKTASKEIRLNILKELEECPKRFVELKKNLNLESSFLAYNLQILEKEFLVKKEEYFFSLTDKGKYFMPYARKQNDASKLPIPCVAVIIQNKKEVLIRMKKEEPGIGRSIFIGGKIELGEDIFQASIRHAKMKVGVELANQRLVCVNNFISKKNNETAHFVVFFILAKIKKGSVPINSEWKNPNKIKNKMYPDNKYILKHFLNSRKINFIQSNYNEDLDSFKVVSKS